MFTWIHCDEDTDSGEQTYFLSKEVESLLLVSDGVLNTLDLHGHHRQHFYRNPVELVETSPCSRLGESLVDVADGLNKLQKMQ